MPPFQMERIDVSVRTLEQVASTIALREVRPCPDMAKSGILESRIRIENAAKWNREFDKLFQIVFQFPLKRGTPLCLDKMNRDSQLLVLKRLTTALLAHF
jgi:hypothetical protein